MPNIHSIHKHRASRLDSAEVIATEVLNTQISSLHIHLKNEGFSAKLNTEWDPIMCRNYLSETPQLLNRTHDLTDRHPSNY